jgi:hypothetical protein
LTSAAAGAATVLSTQVSFAGIFNRCRTRVCRQRPAPVGQPSTARLGQPSAPPVGQPSTAPVGQPMMASACCVWSSASPLIPDAGGCASMVNGVLVNHSISVFGFGLKSLNDAAASQGFSGFSVPAIVDNSSSSSAVWQADSNPNNWTFSSGNGPGGSDVWTFQATETGSTTGVYGSLSITVQVNPNYKWCFARTYDGIGVLYS